MTLVLLHSAGAGPAIWNRVRRHLKGIPLLAPPLPGRAGAGPASDDIAMHGAAVLAAMDAAGVERASIGGHSLGGAVALWLAIEHPKRVAGIGVVNAGARMRVAPAMLATLPDGLEGALELVAQSNFPLGTRRELLEERIDAYRDTGGDTLLADLTACDRFDVLDRLWEIRCRTQVLSGALDQLSPPRFARLMAERISAARYVEYPGAAHMLPIERPAEVAGELAVLWASALEGSITSVRAAPGSEPAGSPPHRG